MNSKESITLENGHFIDLTSKNLKNLVCISWSDSELRISNLENIRSKIDKKLICDLSTYKYLILKVPYDDSNYQFEIFVNKDKIELKKMKSSSNENLLKLRIMDNQ